MSLTHTPAHITDHPDRFENEETGLGYSVMHDIDADDPRTWQDNDHVVLYVFRGPRRHATETVPDSLAAEVFDSYCDRYDAEHALPLTKRHLAAFHPDAHIHVTTATIRGYSQGDWYDVFAATDDEECPLADHIEQFRKWCFGDVWTVIPDGKPGISGIYADSPEEALTYFRENCEDSDHAASEEASDIDPGWLEHIDNLAGGDHVDVSWVVRDERGRNIFASAVTLTPEQATGMLRGIGEASPPCTNTRSQSCSARPATGSQTTSRGSPMPDIEYTLMHPIPQGFWAQIDHQLSRIANTRPETYDEVRSILLDPAYDDITAERDRNFVRRFDEDSAFFAGSGGDPLAGALFAAGWKVTTSQASYYYVMTHSITHEVLTYTEGDVQRGDLIG